MTVDRSDLDLRLQGIGSRLDNIERCLGASAEQLGVPVTLPFSDLPPDVVERARPATVWRRSRAPGADRRRHQGGPGEDRRAVTGRAHDSVRAISFRS